MIYTLGAGHTDPRDPTRCPAFDLAELLTVGTIARRLNRPIHRVEYVIRSREIGPTGRAGNLRVYSEQAVETIAAELDRIDSARAGASLEQAAV